MRFGISAIAGAGGQRRGGPVRWRPASFFITELLGTDEFPHRAVVHRKTARRQFGDQAMQGKSVRTAACYQPVTVLAGKFPGLMAAYLARRHAAGLANPFQPINRNVIADTKPRRRLPP